MKASVSWLKDYVAIETAPCDLAESLTMAGLEVEALTDRYDYLKTVKVGRVVSVAPHPKADKLTRCIVDIGDRLLSVVCGAPNVAEQMLAPLALTGTAFPDGTVLQETSIRGEISQGMLCSEGELGLGPDRSGIMALDRKLTVGETLSNALSLSDPVFEIDLTPNRPDCLSLLGIAREISAIQQTPVRYPEISLSDSSDQITRFTSVTIESPDHCPRYAAKLVAGITVAPSPLPIQDRLLSVGLRPINNIVDITNFVMMETGQPLHAFDFDRLEEQRIVVRTAEAGETFTTLDGKQRKLANDMLMICDGKKPVAVGGVMGGINSEIENSTTRVLIEGAYFSPTGIRRTAKRLGLGTEASHRFERGVDPEGPPTAVNRAAQLMAEIGGGTPIGGIIDEHPGKTTPKTINLSVDKTNRFLGVRLPSKTVRQLLESIEFSVEKSDAAVDTLRVIPPSFRVDVERPEDLMEEVARLSGYNTIPATLPSVSSGNKLPHRELDIRGRIKRLMTGLGFMETVNYSFMSKRWCDDLQLPADDPRRRMVEIVNPLTEDQTVMRTTLIPGMLMTMNRNLAQQIRNLQLFEIGKIFIDNGLDELPRETEMLGGLWTGAGWPASWRSREKKCDFYDIKGAVEGLFRALKIENTVYTRMPEAGCHYVKPGYTTEIRVDGKSIGLIGELRTETLSSFEIKQPAFIFELDVQKLSVHIPDVHKAGAISKFPATSRDITLIVDARIETGGIVEKLKAFKEELIVGLDVFDVFEGDPIPDGKKSLSFRVTYRSRRETLQDESINRLHKELTERLMTSFDAALPALDVND